jgi:3-oxoacyl-[acyl-carrier-protein] synthase-3
MTAGIEAVDYALPERVVTNADLQAEQPAWDMDRMLDRTGVASRHIAAPGETALDFAYQACRKLDEAGRLRPELIDAVIFCTETPDYPIPPNACLLHEKLALRPEVMAFDITLACSGYVYALGIARSLVDSGAARRVLVATADTYSRLIHPGDRSSRVLFGDGGAATIVSGEGEDFRVRDITFGTSGAEHARFIVKAGGQRTPRSEETAQEVTDRSGNVRTPEHIAMDGLGVLSFFNSVVPAAVRALLERNGLGLDDIRSFVFHQASKVALDGVVRGLKLRPDQAVVEMEDVGNLVSASVPVAFARARDKGRFAKGDLVVLCGFGVGLSWATALVEV